MLQILMYFWRYLPGGRTKSKGNTFPHTNNIYKVSVCLSVCLSVSPHVCKPKSLTGTMTVMAAGAAAGEGLLLLSL